MVAAFIFLIGLCVGSFLNVLADRLPRNESVLWGRSHCDYCNRTLRWYELIPVVSYIFLGGRCMRCHKPLSLQYPLVELTTAFGFLYLYARFDYWVIGLLGYWVIFSSLTVIFVADLKYQIIPDSMTLVAAAATLAIRGLTYTSLPALLPYGVSAVAAFVFFYLLWAGSRGRAMGFGDVKFAPVIGLLFDYPVTVIVFYIAFLTGALAGVILMMVGKKGWKSHIAFGPFLIAGMVTTFIWQKELLALWHMFL